MEEPKNKEDALAGLLNGTMFTLLGGIFPAVVAWWLATDWRTVAAGNHTMTATEAMQGIGLTLVSVAILRFGIRMLLRNGATLRRL
ncbi:hypothetical protein [Brevundimonas sp. TWP2-3-4b2]|uniref:hypothetical protein n=1 Tax=Brevundimonas sp. TWP2-3-4b2 TaxID=2804595 RepID=UPI003CE71057